MRVVALVCSLGVATAFMAPMAPRTRRGVVRMSVDDLIGADRETGGVWDPLGLAQDDASLAQYRAAELKHGRVAQLAFLGVLVQSAYQLPDPVFSQTKPLAALQQVYADRPEAIWQIIFAIGFLELTLFRQNPDNAPGDLGFGSAFKPKNDAKLAELQLKELKNGRLAMVGILGALYQESLTGQGPLEQLAAGHINPFGDGQGFF